MFAAIGKWITDFFTMFGNLNSAGSKVTSYLDIRADSLPALATVENLIADARNLQRLQKDASKFNITIDSLTPKPEEESKDS